jgi:hypothetical protein
MRKEAEKVEVANAREGIWQHSGVPSVVSENDGTHHQHCRCSKLHSPVLFLTLQIDVSVEISRKNGHEAIASQFAVVLA